MKCAEEERERIEVRECAEKATRTEERQNQDTAFCGRDQA